MSPFILEANAYAHEHAHWHQHANARKRCLWNCLHTEAHMRSLLCSCPLILVLVQVDTDGRPPWPPVAHALCIAGKHVRSAPGAAPWPAHAPCGPLRHLPAGTEWEVHWMWTTVSFQMTHLPAASKWEVHCMWMVVFICARVLWLWWCVCVFKGAAFASRFRIGGALYVNDCIYMRACPSMVMTRVCSKRCLRVQRGKGLCTYVCLSKESWFVGGRLHAWAVLARELLA